MRERQKTPSSKASYSCSSSLDAQRDGMWMTLEGGPGWNFKHHKMTHPTGVSTQEGHVRSVSNDHWIPNSRHHMNAGILTGAR